MSTKFNKKNIYVIFNIEFFNKVLILFLFNKIY